MACRACARPRHKMRAESQNIRENATLMNYSVFVFNRDYDSFPQPEWRLLGSWSNVLAFFSYLPWYSWHIGHDWRLGLFLLWRAETCWLSVSVSTEIPPLYLAAWRLQTRVTCRLRSSTETRTQICCGFESAWYLSLTLCSGHRGHKEEPGKHTVQTLHFSIYKSLDPDVKRNLSEVPQEMARRPSAK